MMDQQFSKFMRWTSRLMMVVMVGVAMPNVASAQMIETDQAVNQALVEQGRLKIKSFVEREDFRIQLEANGVTTEQAIARVDALTDEEVLKVSGKLDELPAGGDIIGAAVFIFIVLLITDILGLTKVFKFTRSITR